MLISEIKLPIYTVNSEPDTEAIGHIVDEKLYELFSGRKIVLRAIASSEHNGKSIEEIVHIIEQTGTDRYDPERKGDRYENIENKHIDLFAFSADLNEVSAIFNQAVWGFYYSSKDIHGYPMRIDIVIIYDATKMERVHHQHEGRDDIKDDGYKFKDPDHKTEALLGIIKLL